MERHGTKGASSFVLHAHDRRRHAVIILTGFERGTAGELEGPTEVWPMADGQPN